MSKDPFCPQHGRSSRPTHTPGLRCDCLSNRRDDERGRHSRAWKALAKLWKDKHDVLRADLEAALPRPGRWSDGTTDLISKVLSLRDFLEEAACDREDERDLALHDLANARAETAKLREALLSMSEARHNPEMVFAAERALAASDGGGK